jgi:hypothetical protein
MNGTFDKSIIKPLIQIIMEHKTHEATTFLFTEVVYSCSDDPVLWTTSFLETLR